MKLKIYFLIILSIGISLYSFSQETKTYSSENGNFVYQYYENSQMERMYNGTYKELYKNCTIKGQFKDNKKTGNWYYFKKENAYANSNDGIYNREISGNYENDKKNGVWTYKLGYNQKNKKYNSIYNLNFKNDTIIGIIEFADTESEEKELGYSGQLDSLGNFTGIWHKKINSKREDIIEFYKNYIIKILRRDLVTGAIYEKYLPNREIIIKKIDELDGVSLTEGDTYSDFYGRDYGFENTRIGSDFVAVFVRKIIHVDIESQRNDIINDSFFYKKPIYLLSRKKDGSRKLERFNNTE